ncbi:hypothetical protein M011DRAFT_519517 [Sporormia fimetaria CBS 119925]|uniref:Cora-domain-containing protein n=1 Tax=Sporormia fimetaria CBS 119925 TaxID=1340428 RepID=A0A6A6VB01_9PLEO|nr:hypothetical protein M011DRAFT_519517 [Sporormia fimetaria CBS 119925]
MGERSTERYNSFLPPSIRIEDTGSTTGSGSGDMNTDQQSQGLVDLDGAAAGGGMTTPQPNTQPQPSPHPDTNQRRTTWNNKRKPSPNVEWRSKWTADSWKQGRVLLIDYVSKEHTSSGRRKIVAQEFSDIDSLHSFYLNQSLSSQAALRVIHVQNAPWATRFLLRKFNIDASDDLIGTTFGRWARFEKPKRRGQGKAARPVPSGKTFRAQRDPWRGISRAGFGLDYLRHFEKGAIMESPANQGMKMMELNHYDAMDNPVYGFDVYAQRLSVYVQLSDGEPGIPVDPDIRNPYDEEEYKEYQRLRKQYYPSESHQDRYIPKLETLDNGSTIIIFESSQSGSVSHTLIGARQELEQRWRRLTFYLPREDTSNDSRLAIECMDFILRDIFKALAFVWEKYVTVCETHISILEDKIYESPADESRAPELWTNSSLWLKVERLLSMHIDIVKEMRSHLREVAHENPYDDDPWLASSAEELEKLSSQFRAGVVSPTANLSDLMYKSVGIRDARHSLQLGLSMWRLSWITFIFLPLTFVCGFFGMNVSLFEPLPSVKWFFVASVPLFVAVIVGWYGVKHTLSSTRRSPLRRGVYEALYYDLAEAYPGLWTRRGPRGDVVPIGWWSGVKWGLINKWFDPEHTIKVKEIDAADSELGSWSRVKRWLVHRWLQEIRVLPGGAFAGLEAHEEPGAVAELARIATPIALAEADPTAASRMRRFPRFGSLSPPPRRSDRSGSLGRVSEEVGGEVMVEEKSEDEISVAL